MGLSAVSGAHARGGTLALPNSPSNNFLPRLTSLLAVGAMGPPIAPSCPFTSSTLTAVWSNVGRSSLLLGRPRSSSSSASAVSSGVGDEIGDLGERIGNPNPSSLDPMCLTFRALRMTEMALASERTIRTLGSARLLLRLRPCPCPCPCSGERDRSTKVSGSLAFRLPWSFRVEPALLVPELVLLGARLPARDGTRERAREGALLRPVSSSDDE
jgi:hypothetical protein